MYEICLKYTYMYIQTYIYIILYTFIIYLICYVKYINII